ncbi:hypothetical protein MTR_5g025040 [Medicago truncatula]|uniref:Uncharacterized protein n=1 Tax=Medicago truncatula TaxID=3880 RepID=G7K2N6_MEDTR|nr:hypothetical protein MTR_5g025040 [Medicago truncatula]
MRGLLRQIFDLNMFPSKLLSSRGASFVTVSQLRIIFLHGVSFQKKQPFVLAVAVYRNHWLGLSSVDTYCAQDHFHQFARLGGFPRQSHPILKLIWLSCALTIWKERNNQIFNNNVLPLHQLLDQVKLLSFNWLRRKTINFAYTYHEWWRHPLFCMGIFM